MNPISPYDEALHFIKRNPGTGGAASLAKLTLSLYNQICGFSVAECLGNLDDHLTRIALRMVQDYATHGETEDLRSAGEVIANDLYPRLWEMSISIRDARQATRDKWEADERNAELESLAAAEGGLFTDPAKLIPPDTAKRLLKQEAPVYAYHHVRGDWRNTTLPKDAVDAAIDLLGGAELSSNCPESGRMLATRIEGRITTCSPITMPARPILRHFRNSERASPKNDSDRP